MNYQTNGCGACKGFWSFLKPPHHNFFKPACDNHDILYNKGGSKKDRKVADLLLYQDMARLVTSHFYKRKWFSKQWFLFLCYTYYLAVRLFGSSNFNYTNNL